MKPRRAADKYINLHGIKEYAEKNHVLFQKVLDETIQNIVKDVRQFDKKDLIFNNAVRYGKLQSHFTIDDLTKTFNIEHARAEKIVGQLVAEGFIIERDGVFYSIKENNR